MTQAAELVSVSGGWITGNSPPKGGERSFSNQREWSSVNGLGL